MIRWCFLIFAGGGINIILIMPIFTRQSLEASILVSFAILAVTLAGFFERNGTVDGSSGTEEAVASSKYIFYEMLQIIFAANFGMLVNSLAVIFFL